MKKLDNDYNLLKDYLSFLRNQKEKMEYRYTPLMKKLISFTPGFNGFDWKFSQTIAMHNALIRDLTEKLETMVNDNQKIDEENLKILKENAEATKKVK